MYINQTDCRADTTAKGLFIWANISTSTTGFLQGQSYNEVYTCMLMDVAVPSENSTSVKFTEKLSSRTVLPNRNIAQ